MYLGIDLGTSNSVIAGLIDGQARVFRPVDGGDVLPSIIYFDKRGHRLYGRRAYDQAMLSPESVAMGFKRLMGTSTPIQVPASGLTLTPEECSAEIIRQLINQVTTEIGENDITGTVITVPAAFNQMQLEATRRAAEMAGLKRVEFIQEPIAAAMAALAGTKKSGQFLIYDLGGGTFDLALAQSLNGSVSIIAHQGINMLGGRDFDRMLVNEIVRPWLLDNFDLPDNFQRDQKFRRLARIAQLAAEKAKIDLSSTEQATIFASDDEVRMTDNSETDIFVEVPIRRQQFEDMIREPITQTIDLTRQIMEENGYTHENIDRIVFIGGPSRIPLIRDMVSNQLGIPVDLKVDPLTAVALGAAYYCESREWGVEGTSNRKPVQATTQVAQAQNLSFDYPARTAQDDVEIKVRLESAMAEPMQIQIEANNGWASDIVDLTDGQRLRVPVKQMGDNEFSIRLYDARDRHLEEYDQKLTITRTVVTTAKIPATQTIAVKVLDHLHGQRNMLFPLVEKGQMLPAEGKATFKSARELRSGDPSYLSFELFQQEYPERIELNLCVGLFRVAGADLPDGHTIHQDDPIIFNWRMSDSGILQANVTLPKGSVGNRPIELEAPRFYSPQSGQVSFDQDQGVKFAETVLKQAEEEWGDLSAAIGPEGARELGLLRSRLTEQRDTLHEGADDPEIVRRVSEEGRFIRQDIARLVRRHRGETLQRQMGKLVNIFNRVARARADATEAARFDNHANKVQQIIDDGQAIAYDDADRHLAEMRDIFFAAAWRDNDYVATWFRRLVTEGFLFPDQEEFKDLVQKGEAAITGHDPESLRRIVSRLLEARVALVASDTTNELATIVRG